MLNDYIDKCIYINLASRVDRDIEIREQINRAGISQDKVIRFEAITGGGHGCNASHAAVLEMIEQQPQWERVLILEVDFNFLQDITLVHTKISWFMNEYAPSVENTSSQWDVFMLTHLMHNYEPVIFENNDNDDKLVRIHKAGNAAGYIVRRGIVPTLKKIIQDNIEPMRLTGHHWLYLNDVVWTQTMNTFNWYTFHPISCGYQRISYSDLAGKITDNTNGIR